MLTVEIKVNGVLISHIYAYNKDKKPKGINKYYYEYYKVGKYQITQGEVKHNYEDGIEKLVELILKGL